MSRLLRKALGLVAVMCMAVIFGAWGVVSCQDDARSGYEQGNEACTASSTDACTAGHAASGNIRSKRGLENRFLWVWANGSVAEFDIADTRAFFSWGYNLSTRNIRWIDKNSVPRCLTPVGSCSVDYEIWRTEVCDRSGPDTCLFRLESGHTVSFTYGIAFNRRLISCLGTRINWDGSHVRNTWEGSCSSQGQAVDAHVSADSLSVGSGANAVNVGRHLSRGQLARLDRACLSGVTSGAKCKAEALRLYRGLPSEVRRKLAAQR